MNKVEQQPLRLSDFDFTDQQQALQAGFNSTGAWAIHEIVKQLEELRAEVERLKKEGT